MRNSLILGSGRSGTSMVAGTLAKCGYFMGERLYAPREANPKGFFESPQVNGINEDILRRVSPRRPPILGRWLLRDRPAKGQRWLARVPLDTPISSTASIRKRIEALVARQPYCFKDPRFCYTIPAWRPHLVNTVFVCVFRDPSATATSIMKECRDAPYLHSLQIDYWSALEVWRLMYEHVLHDHRRRGEWLFVHFDQVLSGDGLVRLGRFLEVDADMTFPEAKLRRSSEQSEVPADVRDIYGELCEAAEWKLGGPQA